MRAVTETVMRPTDSLFPSKDVTIIVVDIAKLLKTRSSGAPVDCSLRNSVTSNVASSVQHRCAAGGLAVALAGCVSQRKYEESQQKKADLEQEYQRLNQQMSAEVGAKNMQIIVSGYTTLRRPARAW